MHYPEISSDKSAVVCVCARLRARVCASVWVGFCLSAAMLIQCKAPEQWEIIFLCLHSPFRRCSWLVASVLIKMRYAYFPPVVLDPITPSMTSSYTFTESITKACRKSIHMYWGRQKNMYCLYCIVCIDIVVEIWYFANLGWKCYGCSRSLYSVVSGKDRYRIEPNGSCI